MVIVVIVCGVVCFWLGYIVGEGTGWWQRYDEEHLDEEVDHG